MIALIAGQGMLPALVAGRLAAEGRAMRVCELEGFPADPAVAPGAERTRFRIERLGSFIADLTASGATEVVFAGAVRRPPVDPGMIDPATMPLVPRMLAAIEGGDDATLREVLAIFEEGGLAIRAATDLVPELLPEPGLLTLASPGKRDEGDARRAAAITAALGVADVGQACVVSRGQALAVEALPGTDAMLASLPGLRASADLPEGGLLYKAPKPGQDRRIDLPAIGPDTVTGAAEAGLAGLVIEAGGVMVLERTETVARADAAGLYLWVRAPEAP